MSSKVPLASVVVSPSGSDDIRQRKPFTVGIVLAQLDLRSGHGATVRDHTTAHDRGVLQHDLER